MGDLVLTGSSVSKAGVCPCEAVLAMTSECVVPEVFFHSSQSDLLCNFAWHWREAGRPAIPRVLLLTLLGNWDDKVCQLRAEWDLLRLPRPWKHNGERSRDNTGQLFERVGTNPIGPNRFRCIQLEQQVWRSSVSSSAESRSSSTGVRGCRAHGQC